MREAGQVAHSHAGPVAALDAISFGAASKMALPKFIDKALDGKPLMKEVVNAFVTQPLVQGPMGAYGEFLGQTAAGQEINFTSILAEFAGEFSGAPVQVLSAANGRMKESAEKAQAAEKHAEMVSTINELSEASKVLERDPETYAEFINKATEDGSVPDLYIDANLLHQSGIAEQVAELSPSVAEQLESALESGGLIRIPMAEYATTIAPTEFAQSMLEHIKTDEDGFSLAEASEFMQTKGEALRQHIEETLTAQTGDETFKASVDSVKQSVMAELTTANRFTGHVNEAYASLVASFYGVMGAKLGVSPEQLYQDKPLLVRAKGDAGGAYNQTAKVDQQIELYLVSKTLC